MTPAATYIAEENCLQEQLPPELEPAIHDANAHPELYDEYKACVATLRKIPCDISCKGLWEDGQKLVVGKDYEVKEVEYFICHHCHDQGFKVGVEYACRYCNPDGAWRNVNGKPKGRKPTAFPLVPVKREDELWEEVEKLITVNSHWQIPEILRIVKMLKSKYSLTKR